MNILGFMGWASHDPAACIIKTEKKGTFRFCTISEERLNRIKCSYHFPIRSIKYCMDALRIPSLNDIDLVVNDWSQHQESFGSNYSFRRLEYDYLRKYLKIKKDKIKLIPSHHLAHAYSAFMPSGFDEAAILVVDAIGSDLEGTSIYYGKGNKIELIETTGSFSIGKLYDSVTRHILNFDLGEDGKTMGLAAFGEKYANEPPILDIRGRYAGAQVDYSNFMRRVPDNRIINSKIKKCINKEILYNSYFAKVAYEVQAEAEKAMLHLARYAKEKTGCENLCIAGGVALNCVANEKIRLSRLFKNIFIQPAASDAGIPFGLALYGYYTHNKISSYKPIFKHAFMGRTYSDEYVEALLKRFNIPYKTADFNVVAELISEKQIIGWFTGGSEFGPRALGHRSIIADPRFLEMKDIINSKVKHRELYRPFAPSILSEYADEYFELNGNKSPYMLFAPKVHPQKEKIIPAVIHVDNTGRVQTVSKDVCTEFYNLINAFYKITGVPVVLNTSFNDDDEPIVETPLDALICFLKTKIDYLVINSKFIIKKDKMTDQGKKVTKLLNFRENTLKSEYRQLLMDYLNAYSVNSLREFLTLNQSLANFYKKYDAYKGLIAFITKNTKINFIGDRFHYDLIIKIRKEIFLDIKLKKVFFIEDHKENIHIVLKKINCIKNRYPVLIGLYNITEILLDRLNNNSKQVFIIYKDFQIHLENIVSSIEPKKIDLSGIKEYSCEYNLSKNFDPMFK